MNRKIYYYILSGMFLAGIITGCQSPEKKVEKAQENLDQAEQDLNKKQVDSMNEFQTMKADWEKQINDNQRKIEELKDEKAEKKTNVDQDYNNKIASLQKANDDLAAKMNNYQYSSTDTKWQEFKEAFNKDLKKVETDIKTMTDKIKKKVSKDKE